MTDDVLRSILEGDDDAYAQVVADQAQKVIKSTDLPRPGGGTWSPDDGWDLASEFFSNPKAVETTLLAVADDDGLNAYTYTALENQIRQKLRRGTKARLKRRLEELLAEEGWVEEPTGFWSPPNGQREAFGGRLSDLVAPLWAVEVTLVKWSDNAKRNRPFAERSSLVQLLETISDAAQGSVHIDQITEAFSQRLGLGAVPTGEPLDLGEEEADDIADDAPGPEAILEAQEDGIEAAVTAAGLWADLGPDERKMIPFADQSYRDAGEQLNWGKTKAGEVQKRLNAKYEATLADVPEEQRMIVLDKLAQLEQPRASDLDSRRTDS